MTTPEPRANEEVPERIMAWCYTGERRKGAWDLYSSYGTPYVPEARLAELEAERDALVGAAYEAAAGFAKQIAFKDSHSLWEAGCNWVAEAIRSKLIPADAQRALANVRAEALREFRSRVEAVAIELQDDEDDDSMFGALGILDTMIIEANGDAADALIEKQP